MKALFKSFPMVCFIVSIDSPIHGWSWSEVLTGDNTFT